MKHLSSLNWSTCFRASLRGWFGIALAAFSLSWAAPSETMAQPGIPVVNGPKVAAYRVRNVEYGRIDNLDGSPSPSGTYTDWVEVTLDAVDVWISTSNIQRPLKFRKKFVKKYRHEIVTTLSFGIQVSRTGSDDVYNSMLNLENRKGHVISPDGRAKALGAAGFGYYRASGEILFGNVKMYEISYSPAFLRRLINRAL